MVPIDPARVPVDELILRPGLEAAFPPTCAVALERARSVDPPAYARTRNHLRGGVSRLSPYLTHGLVSVPDVLAIVAPDAAGKFAQELAWREFFQLVYEREGRSIFSDRFGPQPHRSAASHPRRLPKALVEGTTGIGALDDAVRTLVDAGYVHNHARMWLASVVCHVAGADWRAGAAWFFFHLLDGDLASNTLSWQWVAGTGSHKPYLANQANLDRFSDRAQRGTFLDRPTSELIGGPVPAVLAETVDLELPAELPDLPPPQLDPDRPLLAYHPWALDPTWHAAEERPRVLQAVDQVRDFLRERHVHELMPARGQHHVQAPQQPRPVVAIGDLAEPAEVDLPEQARRRVLEPHRDAAVIREAAARHREPVQAAVRHPHPLALQQGVDLRQPQTPLLGR